MTQEKIIPAPIERTPENHHKTTILKLLKVGFCFEFRGWHLGRCATDPYMLELTGKERRFYPLNNDGLNQAIAYMYLPF